MRDKAIKGFLDSQVGSSTTLLLENWLSSSQSLSKVEEGEEHYIVRLVYYIGE